MKRIIIFISIFIVNLNAKAQDIDLVAQNYYLQAEDAFNYENYLVSKNLLQKAIETLGKSNSKILDLKIRSTYEAFKKNILHRYETNYVMELRNDIDSFFLITKSALYPKEKYFTIINIKDEVDKWKIVLRDNTKLLSANGIIETCIEARGGEQNLKKINSAIFTYEGALFQDNVEMKAAGKMILIYTKMVPNFSIIETKSGDGDLISKQVFDGTLKKDKGIFEELYYLDGENKIELRKNERINNEDTYVISFTSSTNNVTYKYFNCQTGLLVKSNDIKTAEGKETVISTEFYDYRIVGDVYFPFKIVTKIGSMETQSILKDLKINSGITVDDFK